MEKMTRPANAALIAAYERARAQRVRLARLDPNVFMECVLRDEASGQPVRQAEIHLHWQKLLGEHDRIVLQSFVESAKTSQVSIGRVLWELGRDPARRTCILSNTATQAQKIVRTIAEYIRCSPELHEVFPVLQPGEPWRKDLLTVERATTSKDGSVLGVGLHGPILGSRFDLVVVDDMLDYESTRTQEQRDTSWQWFKSTVLSRVTENGRVWILGTAWHPDDVLHRLSRETGWTHRRFGIVDDAGIPRWPERWTLERIEKKRAELGPFESARQLDCVARADEEAVIKQAWIDAALARGKGFPLPSSVTQPPAGAYLVVGVDLAVSTKSTANQTALVTVAVLPNGDRQLVNVEAGHWAIDEIVKRIVSHHQRYARAQLIVENVGAQDFVRQLVGKMVHIPCEGFKTGGGKMSLQFQTELLGNELAAGRWLLPNDEYGHLAPEVRALVNDLIAYHPAEHVGDRMAALLMARWGAERGEQKVEFGRIDLLSR